eukprot:3662068-Pyramimonas_sp.AAC.1
MSGVLSASSPLLAQVDPLTRGGRDDAVVAALLDGGAQLAALRHDGHHALCLLHAPVLHVADRRGALRNRGGSGRIRAGQGGSIGQA